MSDDLYAPGEDHSAEIQSKHKSSPAVYVWLIIAALLGLLILIGVFWKILLPNMPGMPGIPANLAAKNSPSPAVSLTPLHYSRSMPATWTPQPTATSMPTRMPSAPPSTLVALEPTNSEAWLKAQLDQAIVENTGAQYQAAISVLDKVLVAQPENSEADYQRARAYLGLTDHLTDEQAYQDDLAKSLLDVDKAIRLNPTHGVYFEIRSFVYWDEAGEVDYRVDRQRLLGIALDNMQIAALLTPHGIGAQTNVMTLLGFLGRCQQALDLEKRSLQAGTYSPDTSSTFYSMLARNNLCAGRYSEALAAVNKDLKQNGEGCSTLLNKAIILYNSGQENEAFNVINSCITKSPTFGGVRYYWRALFYFDRGQKDLAEKDLMMGAVNTWSHSGIFDYVNAKLALADGDRDSGAQELQAAEASMNYTDGPVFMARVRRDLAALGLKPVSPTANPELFQVTPMPASFQSGLTPAP